MTTKQWVSIGICGFSVFLFVVSLPVSPGWAWVLLLIGGSIGGVVYAAAYGEKHAGKVQPPALPVQPPAPTAAPKTTRKWMRTIGVLLICMAISLVFFILTGIPSLMRDFHLMRSGTVTRGMVVSRESYGEGSDSGTHFSYHVRFVDNKGQTRVESIGIDEYMSVGDSISILYATDDPTVITVQDGFAAQVQDDEGFAELEGAITIGCALAILVILFLQLRRHLTNHTPPNARKKEATVGFMGKAMCFFGIHQGEWTRTGCQLRRYCILCGKPQNREWHNFSQWEYVGEHSCETRVTCLDCGKTRFWGIQHEGEIGRQHDGHWWKYDWHCKRCGENLYEDPGD